MNEVDELVWLRFVEGLQRGDLGPFIQQNTAHGENCCRMYLDGENVVGRMRVYGGNADKPSHECARTFELTQSAIDATSHIHMPTQEEWNELHDREALDLDFDCRTELALLDPGWAS